MRVENGLLKLKLKGVKRSPEADRVWNQALRDTVGVQLPQEDGAILLLWQDSKALPTRVLRYVPGSYLMAAEVAQTRGIYADD